MLLTIPGIQDAGAANILAEIGANMNQFPDGDHLCSWAGICSGNNRSAGKRKNSHIKKANKFLLAALVESSWGAARKKDSVFQRKFYRWLSKLGKKKACIAICRSLLRVVWSVLKSDRAYIEPDATLRKTLERDKQVHHHAARLRQLGADEQTVAVIVKGLLESPPSDPPNPAAAPLEAPAPDPARPRTQCSPNKEKSRLSKPKPVARGVLGFRLRTRDKKYSVFKEPPGTKLSATTPETTTASKGPHPSSKARGRPETGN